MNKNRIKHALLIACTMVIGQEAAAVPNPINQDYVTLTDADWAKVCVTGSINSPGGCYGDISSAAFKKINRIGQDFLGVNALLGGGANTVWIRQLGNGTACSVRTPAVLQLRPVTGTITNDWTILLFTTAGLNVGGATSEIGYNAVITSGYQATTHTFTGPAGLTWSDALRSPGVGFYSSNGQLPTVYAVVVSTAPTVTDPFNPAAGYVTPFVEAPQIGFDGTAC